MNKVCLFGAGKIGQAICALLSSTPDYQIKVCDLDFNQAQDCASKFQNVTAFKLDLNNQQQTLDIIKDTKAVMSALPYFCNVDVAKACAKANVHYLDLTEDVNTTSQVLKLASDTSPTFIPQCGLAPGFISIVAAHLCHLFDKLEDVKLRVGALPIFPSNKLKYNLTWSTNGLINEYGNLCEAVVNSKKLMLLPLEGLEHFSLDGCEYECFNTSGGLGSLSDTLEGRANNVNYKTIRYPGHCELMQLLMNELKFNQDRENLKNVLERSLPTTKQDKCIIFVEVTGLAAGKFAQKTYASTVYNTNFGSQHLSAIQLTTAAGIVAPLDMLLNGKLKAKRGVVQLEDISLIEFLNNRFGKYYKDERALSGLI